MSLTDAILPLAALALIAAALHDVAARTIPNAIPGLVALLGLVSRVAQQELAWGLLAFLVVLALGILAWRFRVMGGGDVKLLAACALLVPPGAVPGMLAAIALAGGLLALFYLAFRGRRLALPQRAATLPARALRAEIWRLRRGGPLPYAVAIAAGAILAMTG
jgi:prepilin peptidase CpaA